MFSRKLVMISLSINLSLTPISISKLCKTSSVLKSPPPKTPVLRNVYVNQFVCVFYFTFGFVPSKHPYVLPSDHLTAFNGFIRQFSVDFVVYTIGRVLCVCTNFIVTTLFYEFGLNVFLRTPFRKHSCLMAARNTHTQTYTPKCVIMLSVIW